MRLCAMASLSCPLSSLPSYHPLPPAACALPYRHGCHYYTSSDEDAAAGRRPRGKRSSKPLRIRYIEFPTFVAKEEEMFFCQLLALPWQRGRPERRIQRLEKKIFPNHCLDSFMSESYHNRQREARDSSPAEAQPLEKVKFDYLKMAKALRSAFVPEHTFHSQPLNPAHDNRLFWRASSCDVTKAILPSIRTIRAPLSSTDPPPSVDPSAAVDAGNRDSSVGLKPAVKPMLLKVSSRLPRRWNMPTGIVVLIDKPKGWTSFDVCGKLRNLVKVRKVGHAGTLDPLATGLLVVCVGAATKLVDSYQVLPKVYTGTFRLGEATPTDDAESEVKEKKPWEHVRDEDVSRVKEAFVGDIMQIPPMFSAIKVQGERLYEKARKGEKLDIPARRVSVYEFDVNRSTVDRQNFNFRVSCSKGTYVRSLCADLGRALGSCAHLIELRREKIGDLSVNEAWGITELATAISH